MTELPSTETDENNNEDKGEDNEDKGEAENKNNSNFVKIGMSVCDAETFVGHKGL